MAKKSDNSGVQIILGLAALVFTLAAFRVLAKASVCKHYFPEMNRALCLIADLPPTRGSTQ